jgi:hypothetical protein
MTQESNFRSLPAQWSISKFALRPLYLFNIEITIICDIMRKWPIVIAIDKISEKQMVKKAREITKIISL